MSVSRHGIHLSDEELSILDSVVSPLIKNRSNYCTYSQNIRFEKYIQENPDTSIVEMDTVEGTKGGKVLFTMLFRNSKLMLAFLLDDKNSKFSNPLSLEFTGLFS